VVWLFRHDSSDPMHLYISMVNKHRYYFTDLSVVFILTTDLIFATGWICETLYFDSQQSSILHSAVTFIRSPFSVTLFVKSKLKIYFKLNIWFGLSLKTIFPFF